MNNPSSHRSGTFAVVSILAALCHIACAQAPQNPAPQNSTPNTTNQSLHFMVFGDWGTGKPEQKEVAEAMAQYAARHRDTNAVQFVIATGDNFYEDGVKGVDDPIWNERFEQMYDRARLPMPFIAVLGNHDWRGDAGAQIAYRGTHPGTRWQMDGFWFKRSFPIGAAVPLVDFFFVDTDLWNYDVRLLKDAQMKWLQEQVPASRAKWQIIVAHHPLYSNGDHGRDKDVLALRGSLSPLFKTWGVDAYLCGHDHDLQRISVPDHPTLFLVSGAGAKLRPKKFDDWKPFHASTLGFAAITLTPTELSGSFIGTDGKALDTFRHSPVAPLATTPAVTATR